MDKNSANSSIETLRPPSGKRLFVVNPKSGEGGAAKLLSHIHAAATRAGIAYDTVVTKGPKQATTLAREAIGLGYEVVVAVGGDGTVNETASGLVGQKHVALGIVPNGSGNGLARHLGIPLDPQGALSVVFNGTAKSIDACSMNGRWFFCTAGLGFDAHVSQKFGEKGRGFYNYLRASLDSYKAYAPKEFTYSIDGQAPASSKAFVFAVANASEYGNGFSIAPEADTADGLLDLVLVRPFGPLALPGLVWGAYAKKTHRNRHVSVTKSKTVEVLGGEVFELHLDGEPSEAQGPLLFKCHPGVLNVLV